MNLLEAAKKALPGLEWRCRSENGVGACTTDGMPISLYTEGHYCAVLLGAHPRSTCDSIEAALKWTVSRLTAHRDALNAALGEKPAPPEVKP